MDDQAERPNLSEDAAIVIALAETALPFAGSRADETERWVRIMRLHGEVGCALQALGVPDGPLETGAREPSARPFRLTRRAREVVDGVSVRARDGRSHVAP